jgi:ribonuclease-3
MGYQTKGDITEAKKSLESKEVLAQIAADIGIANVVRLGAGERYQQAEKNQRILAETLEALIGAIYFDGGFRATRESIKYLFRAAFPEDI